MTTTLTVREIREKYTIEEIVSIFKENNMSIRQIDNKKSNDYGMIIAFNKYNSYYLFGSYPEAYCYFLEMNWI